MRVSLLACSLFLTFTILCLYLPFTYCIVLHCIHCCTVSANKDSYITIVVYKAMHVSSQAADVVYIDGVGESGEIIQDELTWLQ